MRAGVVSVIVAAISPLLLGGCVTNDPYISMATAKPVGNWKVERQADRITGTPMSSALLLSRNSAHSGDAFTHPAALQLMCFKDQPIVRLAFEFKVGSNKNSVLGYRFDDKPGREIEARFLQDYKTAVIEKRADVAQFVSDLAASNLLYVRIRSLNAGRSSAEFNLEGAPTAIEAAYAGCPISTEPSPKTASAR